MWAFRREFGGKNTHFENEWQFYENEYQMCYFHKFSKIQRVFWRPSKHGSDMF